MKIINLIGVVLIVLGISMTVLTFLAARQPIADVQSFTVHEIAPRGAGAAIFRIGKHHAYCHPGAYRNNLHFYCAAEDQASPRCERDNRKGRCRGRFDMGNAETNNRQDPNRANSLNDLLFSNQAVFLLFNQPVEQGFHVEVDLIPHVLVRLISAFFVTLASA